MSHLNHDINTKCINFNESSKQQRLGANTLIGSVIYNKNDEDLGSINEIVLDANNGEVCYAVLAYGGFLGMGKKLFAVPWQALELDTENKRYLLNVNSSQLDLTPGFDKKNWPTMADETLVDSTHSYYGMDMKNTSSPHSAMSSIS